MYTCNITKIIDNVIYQIKNNVYLLAMIIIDYRNPPVSVALLWSAAADFRWAYLISQCKKLRVNIPVAINSVSRQKVHYNEERFTYISTKRSKFLTLIIPHWCLMMNKKTDNNIKTRISL
jgi:hypothetical protein